MFSTLDSIFVLGEADFLGELNKYIESLSDSDLDYIVMHYKSYLTFDDLKMLFDSIFNQNCRTLKEMAAFLELYNYRGDKNEQQEHK
ncbi:MAG: hypothetical protein ACP5T9_05890 [Thermoplasmata archaeon]